MGLLCFAIASACDPEIIVTRTEVVMNLPPGACAATMRPTTLNLTALGDFPSGEGTLAFSRLDMGDPLPIDDFPFETRALSLRVQDPMGRLWESVRLLTGEPRVETLLLPPGEPCVANDLDVVVPDGAAVAPAKYGGFVIVGGLDRPRDGNDAETPNDATRRIVYVPANGGLSTVHSLSEARAFATATRAGDYIVVAGGVDRNDSIASDSYEVLDARTGEPVLGPAQMTSVRRRDHGAVALSDGRVLVVGGVERVAVVREPPDRWFEVASEPYASVIAIDPETGEVDDGYAALTDLVGDVAPRRSPRVVALDDGSVVITDGSDSIGLASGVFYIAPGETTPVFALRSTDVPQARAAVTVALPGARLARLGGRGTASDALVTVMLFENGVPAEVEHTGFGTAYMGLDNAQAIALEDGRIYASGDGGQAFLFDTGREAPMSGGVITVLPPPPQDPRALLRLDDGTIVELGDEVHGDLDSYFRRLLSPPRTQWDAPPGLGTLTLEDEEWLTIDAYSHIDRMTGSAMPGMTARVDVASAVFRDVAVTVIASGQVDLIFQEERGPAFTRVGVTPNQASVSGVCDLDMPCAEHVRIERRGAELVLMCPDTGAVKGCAAFADPAAGLRVALRLYDDSRLEGITIERL